LTFNLPLINLAFEYPFSLDNLQLK